MSRKSMMEDTQTFKHQKSRLSLLPRQELQTEAKSHGIKANMKNNRLIVALAEFLAASETTNEDLESPRIEPKSDQSFNTGSSVSNITDKNRSIAENLKRKYGESENEDENENSELNSTFDILPEDQNMKSPECQTNSTGRKSATIEKKSPRFVEYVNTPSPIRHSPRIQTQAIDQIKQRKESLKNRLEREIQQATEKKIANGEIVLGGKSSDSVTKSGGKNTPIKDKFARMHAKQQSKLMTLSEERKKVMDLHNKLTKGANKRLKALATPKKNDKQHEAGPSSAKETKTGEKSASKSKIKTPKIAMDFKFGGDQLTPNKFIFGQNSAKKRTLYSMKKSSAKKQKTALPSKSTQNVAQPEKPVSLLAPKSAYHFSPTKEDVSSKILPFRNGPKRPIWARDKLKAAAQTRAANQTSKIGKPLKAIALIASLASKKQENDTPAKREPSKRAIKKGSSSTGKIYRGALPPFVDTTKMTFEQAQQVLENNKVVRSQSATKLGVKDRKFGRQNEITNQRVEQRQQILTNRQKVKENLMKSNRGLK